MTESAQKMADSNDKMLDDLRDIQMKAIAVFDRKELASVFNDVATFMERVNKLKHYKMSTKKEGYNVVDCVSIPERFHYTYAQILGATQTSLDSIDRMPNQSQFGTACYLCKNLSSAKCKIMLQAPPGTGKTRIAFTVA